LITFAWFFILPNIISEYYPDKIEHEGKVAYFMGLLIHQGTYIFTNLLFYFAYILEIEFFERYKVNERPWPWNEDKEKWNKQRRRLFLNLIINQVMILPVLSLMYLIYDFSPISMQKSDFPSSWEIIFQTIFFMICEDCTFYWSHRLLHMEFFYNRIHKQHHEFNNTISVGAEYCHPLEFIFGNVITTNSGPLLLGKRCHFVTFSLWIIMKTSETIEGHSGYEFSWSPYRLIPFSSASEYHNFHHQNTKGNFSSCFTYWDKICGTTNPSFLKYEKVRNEALLDITDEKKSKSS